MYLSHGLPRIILAKRIRARSNHASSVIHAKGRARRRDRSNQASSVIHAKGRARRRARSNNARDRSNHARARFTPKAAPAGAPAQEGRARSRLTVMSTKGRARRRDRSRLTVHRRDRKRAQTAWLVGEPEAAEIVVGAAKILVRVERPVHIDIDRAFGCVLELRREIARQRLEIGGLRI